jgi:GAF domain-containing protein
LAVAQALSGRAPLEEIMRRVGREVARAIDADAVGAYFLDVSKEALVPVAGYRLPKNFLEMFRRTSLVLSRAPGLREAIRTQQVLWSPDGSNDPRFDRDAYGDIPPHSALFAPTVARGETIGGLYIAWWHTGREFVPAEIRLIEGVAAQVGLALENVDLARQTETKLRETETLISVSRALSSTLDLQSLLRHLLRRLARVLDADALGSYMLSEDGEWLSPFQGYRLPLEHLEGLRRLRLSIRQYPFYAEGALEKRPVFSRRAAEDPRIPPIVRDNFPHRSQLFVPIIAKDRVIGGLVAVWWRREHEFSEGDLTLIEAVATQAGVALENARLFEENRRQVKELSVLHALSRAVTGELDRRALIESLYAQVALVFDTRDFLILLPGHAEGEVVVALRIHDGERDSASFERCSVGRVGLGAEVMKTGLSLRTADYPGECTRRSIECSPGSLSTRYWLGVPMTAGDAVLGVVGLGSAERPFTDADERLLTNVARLAALALRIARLFEERESAYSELYLLSLITHRALRRWHDAGSGQEA